MSEQLISAIPSGTGPTKAIQPVSETGAAMRGGNLGTGIGKALPALPTSPSEPALKEFLQQLNIENKIIGRDLRFRVDLDKGYAVIQVLDRETGELIRQIPPEKASAYVKVNGALEMRLYDELV